ncbi:hypothetical protein [Vibrio scophthalmi]|uniref:Uncharacterized protein n=1 Tax=Vibrio scophthalmi LMG 19158 TaxID=870967 RepID=F9RPR9_9VIBR|nr:hypothetical protein [Vibrio scophthalmi]EGU35366.1 hypothetical protein VIS19158_18421 [Vibrio scophthalmi LMG 19158]
MDIYELGEHAQEMSSQHEDIHAFRGNEDVYRQGTVIISILLHLPEEVSPVTDDYEGDFKHIMINPCTKESWKNGYRLARQIKNSVIAKYQG